MIENKSMAVSFAEEQSTIDKMQAFGWKLMSSQEINNANSRLEYRNNDLYCVTTERQYVKLVFERDSQIPNYIKLVDLERQFNSLLYPKEPSSFFLVVGIICVLAAIIPLFMAISSGSWSWHFQLGDLYLINIPFSILFFIIDSKKRKKYNDLKYKIFAQKNDIYNQAKKLQY